VEKYSEMIENTEKTETYKFLKPLTQLTFKGKHIVEFLKKYEMQARLRGATDHEKVMNFPMFCKLDPYVEEQITDLGSYVTQLGNQHHPT
jgi:hypothetical protein